MKTLALFALLGTANVALACGGAAKQPVVDVTKAEGTQVTLAVAGMTCEGCRDKIHAMLSELDGVNAAEVDYEKGTAHVAYDEKKLDEKKLIKAIEKLDYKVKVADQAKG